MECLLGLLPGEGSVHLRERTVVEKRRLNLDSLVYGLTIMAVGAGLMLYHGRLDGWALLLRLWPMQLVAWGLATMLNGWRNGRPAGGVLLLAGILLQMLMLRVIDARTLLPLLLVVIGVGMAWNGVVRPGSRTYERVE